MRYSIAIAAIIPLVAAHGKIAVMTGDAGGNTTGLGIQGGIVPGPGKNKVTEVDTTVFNSKNAATDGLGKTSAGPNTMADMASVMAQSGSTLPQVSDGGSLTGTVHIVTTDGAGPYSAIVDPTATGAFSQGTQAKVTTQVPGTKGNIAAPKQRSIMMRSLVNMGIVKRASNVNEDYPIAIQMPAGMSCTGTVAGQQNVCLVKIANPSGAGPFGGVVAMQMAGAGSASASNSTAAATDASTGTAGAAGAATSSTKAAKANKANKRSIGAKFRA
ncbi:putative gEgh 16 protein [Rutstroemia sp. NJR-2017a WRK4]|nr:putative gEgh 16 protein [Rutstroemia sp. NJR-2017a WRK4]